jgi:hypothetical protein
MKAEYMGKGRNLTYSAEPITAVKRDVHPGTAFYQLSKEVIPGRETMDVAEQGIGNGRASGDS